VVEGCEVKGFKGDLTCGPYDCLMFNSMGNGPHVLCQLLRRRRLSRESHQTDQSSDTATSVISASGFHLLYSIASISALRLHHIFGARMGKK